MMALKGNSIFTATPTQQTAIESYCKHFIKKEMKTGRQQEVINFVTLSSASFKNSRSTFMRGLEQWQFICVGT
jgi:hypothetical protein